MQIITEIKEWNEKICNNFPESQDIYFLHEYFTLYSQEYGFNPEAIFWEDDNICIFWSHLVRDLNRFSVFKEFNLFDLVTPYGYGGPIVHLKVQHEIAIRKSIVTFWNEYQKYCAQKKYISEFIRFHPIYNFSYLFKELFEITPLNDVVIVDLSKSEDDIYKNFIKNKRYQIRKSIEKNCCTNIIEQPTEDDIKIFLNLYEKTMDKNEASKKYYFSGNFIKNHFHLLEKKCILCIAEYNSEIIGASMFIFDKKIIHYHLSGSLTRKDVYPSDLILWDVMKWGHNHGFQTIHLGGGRGKNDSLYQYKKGFSDSTRPFIMGKIIFNPIEYEKLKKLNPNSVSSSNYFPQYRDGLDETII